MTLARAFGLMAVSMSLLMLTACGWDARIVRRGQTLDAEVIIGGDTPAARLHAMTAIAPGDLYIDTTGTDFTLRSSGNVALTVADASGAVIGARAFPWTKLGERLVFQNPAAVQGWLNRFPSAASVAARLTYGNTPADGADHVMRTAVVYQGTVKASVTRTFPAECMTPDHTRQPCRQ